MAKNDAAAVEQFSAPQAAPEAVAEVSGDAFALSLHEFCTRASATDRRVELIGGFEHAERVAGRVKDTEAAYAARLAAFANQPA